MNNSSSHQIVFDRCGLGSRERVTCVTCEQQVIWQPFMNESQWVEMKREFMNQHPESQTKEAKNHVIQ